MVRRSLAFPHSDQEHLLATRVSTDVENMGITIYFKKAGPPRIGSQRRTGTEEQTKLCQLPWRMIAEILNQK